MTSCMHYRNNTDAETEGGKWAVGHKWQSGALDGTELPGTYAKGHGVGQKIDKK